MFDALHEREVEQLRVLLVQTEVKHEREQAQVQHQVVHFQPHAPRARKHALRQPLPTRPCLFAALPLVEGELLVDAVRHHQGVRMFWSTTGRMPRK
eukprot:9483911-Pyramimonas_sp.AAC.1